MDIKEFNPDYVFNLFKPIDREYLSQSECKMAILYISGKKIKKKNLPDEIYQSDFELIHKEYISIDYKPIIDRLNTAESFKNKIKQYFPNLPTTLVSECYSIIDPDSTGKIKSSYLEYILNN
jgi:hypothetical protein